MIAIKYFVTITEYNNIGSVITHQDVESKDVCSLLRHLVSGVAGTVLFALQEDGVTTAALDDEYTRLEVYADPARQKLIAKHTVKNIEANHEL